MRLSNFYSLCLGTALSLALAASANATIVGSTYDFNVSASGGASITSSPTTGTFTDPANPAFCVGPNTDNCSSSGLSGSFTFANVSSTLDTITFHFTGSNAGSGSFTVGLSNFVTTDGSSIIGVNYASGSLGGGDSTSASWDGTTASFTGTTSSYFNSTNSGGNTAVFNVTTSAVPEPASVALLGLGLVGLGFSRRKKA